MESCLHKCKDNDTASTFHLHAPPSPPQADYSLARHHRWMSSMSQIERIIVIISFRPSNYCPKLNLLHCCYLPRCHPLRCRAAPLFPALPPAALLPVALMSTAKPLTINHADVQGDAVRSDTVRESVTRPRRGRHNTQEAGPAARPSITTLSPVLKLTVTAVSTSSDGMARCAFPGVPFPAWSGVPSLSEPSVRHPCSRQSPLTEDR